MSDLIVGDDDDATASLSSAECKDKALPGDGSLPTTDPKPTCHRPEGREEDDHGWIAGGH